MRVIAFAGQARSGKTTFARSFAAASFDAGATPTIRSFAGPLKRAAEEAGFAKDIAPESYRSFCQVEGAAKRAENPDYWLDLFRAELGLIAAADAEHLADTLESGLDYHETVVLIDDMRYENEYELVKEIGGQNILVMRPNGLPEADAAWRDHESEEFGNYWASADEDDQDGMFNMVFVNDVANEQVVMEAGKPLFAITMLEPMIPTALEEGDLDDDDDDTMDWHTDDPTLNDLLDLFKKLKDEADIGFGLTDEDIDLGEDDDDA
jgi:hypothetical protein